MSTTEILPHFLAVDVLLPQAHFGSVLDPKINVVNVRHNAPKKNEDEEKPPKHYTWEALLFVD
jgi:hypothetical protein